MAALFILLSKEPNTADQVLLNRVFELDARQSGHSAREVLGPDEDQVRGVN